jgi:hypothetical protein
MGFSSAEVSKLVFKVQASGVIDAASGTQWYESRYPYNPSISANRVLLQFEQLKQYPASNLNAARAASSLIPNILQDKSVTATRLTQATPGDNNTWVAFNLFNDRSSGVLDLWIQPQKILKSNGEPSNGYQIALFSGDPERGGVSIPTTLGQSGDEVGWIFNYDMGMLFISNNLISIINSNSDFFTGGLDFYIKGFRYIGTTLASGIPQIPDNTQTPLYSYKEKPSGVIDGVNKKFYLAHSPIDDSEHIYINGLLSESGIEGDYMINGNEITFSLAPQVNAQFIDRILCSYRYQ